MSDNTDPNAVKHGIVLPERVYDLLKDLDLIALPALGSVAGAALALYGVPATVTGTVVGTITIIITVIGILLKISNVQYKAEAKVDAIKAASIVNTYNSGPGIAADPTQVVVEDPSQ